MKKVLSILLTTMLVATLLLTAFAEGSTNNPALDSQAKYNIKDATFNKDEMFLTGTVEHDASTDSVDRVYARITFFFADGSFTAFATIVDDDGTFQAMCSGDVIHIAVQVTNNTKVRPGQYNAYGGNEFDVE